MSAEVLVPVARRLIAVHRVPHADPTALARALARAHLRRIDRGAKLCELGGTSDRMFVLLDGEVRVQRHDFNGEMRELARLTAPSVFGHMGLIDHSPRSATCIACHELRVLILGRAAYNDLVGSGSPEGHALRRLVIASLIRQLTDAHSLISRLGQEAPPPAEPDPTETAAGSETTTSDAPNEEAALLELAGVLDGWTVDRSGLREDVSFTAEENRPRRTPKRYP